MFRLLLIIFYLGLGACASNPRKIQYALGSVEGDSGLSKITSICDSGCSKLVQSEIEYFIPWVIKTVRPAILNEIDGEAGPTTARCLDCVITRQGIWNEKGNYGFEIFVPSGSRTVGVSHNHHMAYGGEEVSIKILMKPGHSYFIGNLMKETSSPLWSPVVVDTTDMKVLFPTEQPW